MYSSDGFGEEQKVLPGVRRGCGEWGVGTPAQAPAAEIFTF